MPLFVATKMSRIKNPNILVPGPQDYARESLGTLGVSVRTNGCWSHALQVDLSFASPHPPSWNSGVEQLLVTPR